MNRISKLSLILKDFFKRADVFLLVSCIVCTVFGIIAINSATSSYETSKFVIVQAFSMLLGITAFIIFTVIDADLIADKWIYLSIFNAILVLILIPFGVDDGTGNKAWLRFFGIGIQPSEVAKVIFIVLIAKQMAFYKERRELDNFGSVFMLALHWFALFGLVVAVSSDLGSALILLAIFIVMLVAAGVAWYWLAAAGAALAALIPFAWNFIFKDYQKERILAPYIPDVVDPTGTGITWQTNRCKNAMEAGRLTGVGYGNGTLNIEARHTDCIFASIGEELGMIACIAVLIFLTVIIIRCVIVGIRSGSTFGMLICFGVAASIAFQTFINVGMCIGISPVIGITLPFFSYGGSSIVTTYAAVGLVSGVKFRPKPRQNFIQVL